MTLSLLVVLLLPLVSSQSWFNSTCDQPFRCGCRTVSGIECLIGKSDENSTSLSCNHLPKNLVTISIKCQQFRSCDSVNVKAIIEAYPAIRNLSIYHCSVITEYEDPRKRQPMQWKVKMGRLSGDNSSFAIFLQTNTSRDHRALFRCPLYVLKIFGAHLLEIPMSVVHSCKQLIELELNNNDLTIIDKWAFEALSSLPRLVYLSLRNNYITFLGPSCVEEAMQAITNFMVCELHQWLINNNESMNDSEFRSLSTFSKNFKNWSNASSALTPQRLIDLLLYSGAKLRFVLNNWRLDSLYLENNSLRDMPDVIIFMYRLKNLHLDSNKLMNALNDNFYPFYNLNDTLTYLSIRDNNMMRINKGALNFLCTLISINLQSNKIIYMSKRTIPTWSRLRYLYLNHNRLKKLRFGDPLPHLRYINADYNFIPAINNETTRNLQHLEKLSLVSNHFQVIDQGALVNMKRLMYLNLSNNAIKKMPYSSYRTDFTTEPGDRPIVDISGNNASLLCDCYSVFAVMASQQGTGPYYTPKVIWSPSQKCVNQVKGGDTFGLSLDVDFLCHITDRHCRPNCGCCSHMNCNCTWECPHGCDCIFTRDESYKVINCSSRSYHYVPQTETNTTVYDLGGNNIEVLQPYTFSRVNSDISSLHLNNNHIVMLGNNIFSGLTKLHYLDLSLNKISSIDSKAFVDLSSVKTIFLSQNSLTTLHRKVFENLQNLTALQLEGNPLECDCDNLPDFLDFTTSRAIYAAMPSFCNAAAYPDLKTYMGVHEANLSLEMLPEVCRLIAEKKAAARLQVREWMIGGISAGVALLVVAITFVAGVRHRHILRLRLDASVRSSLGRTLFSLSACNTRGGVDVGFLVHERQTEHFYDIRRRLVGTPREALKIVRMADHMPGATRLTEVARLASNMAVCVVLLSLDFLQDSLFMEALRILLLHNVERPGSSVDRLSIIPVLVDKAVVDTDEWSRLELMLRHYPLLRWRQPYFWERLVTLLPPPPPPPSRNRADDSEALSGREVARSLPEANITAHLCVIAHEHQVATHVRCLYERYRANINICHVRHGQLFGSDSEFTAVDSLSLNSLLGTCLQVAVVVSLELLNDEWTHSHLIKSLTARLYSLPFRGTIILLEIGTGFSHLSQEPKFAFYDRLRHNNLTVTLAWPDLERNWATLNAHLLPELICRDPLNAASSGMDEEQYVAQLMSPLTRLSTADPQDINIFHQNRARWSVHGRRDGSGL